MKGWPLFVAALLGLLGWAVLRLVSDRLGAGEVHPRYSSLRSDPQGARALYESLAAERNYRPLENWRGRGSTLVYLGLDARWARPQLMEQLEKAASRGNRVVVGLTGTAPAAKSALAERWKVQIAGKTQPYFRQTGDWKLLYGRPQRGVLLERPCGAGTLVLAVRSEPFTNQALAFHRDTLLLARALGTTGRVVFDEAHLGSQEQGSIAALLQRYHLSGVLLALVAWAGLWIWKNASQFPPLREESAEPAPPGRDALSGLTSLLGRHVAPRDLPGHCWSEWRAVYGRRLAAADAQTAETLLAGPAAPLEQYHALAKLLRERRYLRR